MLAFLALSVSLELFSVVEVAEKPQKETPQRGNERRSELWDCSLCGEWYVRGREDSDPQNQIIPLAAMGTDEDDDLF